MFKILLIISVIVSICCLCVVIACLFAASKENSLPDIEDVEIVELFTSKIQNA
jgi:hypothetical protein